MLECGKTHRVAGLIEPERCLSFLQRLDILHDDVLRPVSRRPDRKVRITTGIDAGVIAHRCFKRLLLPGGDASRVVDSTDARIAVFQIQAVDIVPELAAADGLRCDKHSPSPEQHVGISADPRFNGVTCIGDGAFELQPGLAFHLI